MGNFYSNNISRKLYHFPYKIPLYDYLMLNIFWIDTYKDVLKKIHLFSSKQASNCKIALYI